MNCPGGWPWGRGHHLGRGRGGLDPAAASQVPQALGGGERGTSFASVFQASVLLTQLLPPTLGPCCQKNLPHTATPAQPGPCCQKNLPKILLMSHHSPAQKLPAVASHCPDEPSPFTGTKATPSPRVCVCGRGFCLESPFCVVGAIASLIHLECLLGCEVASLCFIRGS